MSRVISSRTPIVTIEVDDSKVWRLGGERVMSLELACKLNAELVGLIKRHIEPHFSSGMVIDWAVKNEGVCSHCGYKWSESSTEYNGGCCDADQADFETAALAKVTPA